MEHVEGSRGRIRHTSSHGPVGPMGAAATRASGEAARAASQRQKNFIAMQFYVVFGDWEEAEAASNRLSVQVRGRRVRRCNEGQAQ